MDVFRVADFIFVMAPAPVNRPCAPPLQRPFSGTLSTGLPSLSVGMWPARMLT